MDLLSDLKLVVEEERMSAHYKREEAARLMREAAYHEETADLSLKVIERLGRREPRFPVPEAEPFAEDLLELPSPLPEIPTREAEATFAQVAPAVTPLEEEATHEPRPVAPFQASTTVLPDPAHEGLLNALCRGCGHAESDHEGQRCRALGGCICGRFIAAPPKEPEITTLRGRILAYVCALPEGRGANAAEIAQELGCEAKTVSATLSQLRQRGHLQVIKPGRYAPRREPGSRGANAPS